MSDVVEENGGPMNEPPSPKNRTARIVGIALILFSVILAWLLMVGFFAYRSGQQKLTERQQTELLAALERQITLADENIGQGNYQLALARLEWVLQREASNGRALQLKQQATQALNQPSAPQDNSQPTISPTPTFTPEPSPTPGKISSPEEELQRLRRLSVNKVWADAIVGLVTFQQQFPSYEREETDKLLFDAYVAHSQALLQENKMEQGLFYLSQAEQLGDLPQSMLDYRMWAQLYTQGMAFYGVKWDTAAYYFRDLCLAAPFFGDACSKLHTILVSNGDQYAFMLEWCPAQLLYEEAARHNNTTAVAEKVAAAREGCLTATPVPTEPLTDTWPITDTLPISDTGSINYNYFNTAATPGSPLVIPTVEP